MLERYAVKVACTVLRRERAGNRSFLFDLLMYILLRFFIVIYELRFIADFAVRLYHWVRFRRLWQILLQHDNQQLKY